MAAFTASSCVRLPHGLTTLIRLVGDGTPRFILLPHDILLSGTSTFSL
jgi:hypothetical protein